MLTWLQKSEESGKFPLVTRSGRIRKLLLETKDTKVSRINLTGLPGEFDAFEFVTKFCYGVNVEITISNVALLRCAARFIKDISEKNLKICTEKRQRIIVETKAGLLPTQSRKSAVPMDLLSSLLKSAIAASASTSCWSDLERRIGLQLDQSILEDILIPANPYGNNHSPLYDIDSILRVFFFLEIENFCPRGKSLFFNCTD
ncbi:hypothetical protein CQW23_04433 [Capsicum baccatum]|uniref:NPH3 domain-containing protein n=1 Tax=Capsicum baccatum TaxID=33114 RepID=A0A2G2XEP0_CAPBA|nr:hypothetical protein CQW23_04433 [Capsicum baccatum]